MASSRRVSPFSHRIRIRQKAMVVAAGWGTELFPFHAAGAIQHEDDLKKRMNRKTDTWRNGCFGKMDDHPVYTTSNHHPPKMDVISKTFFKSSLLLNDLCGMHSSTSPLPLVTTFAFVFCLIFVLCLQRSPHVPTDIVNVGQAAQSHHVASLLSAFSSKQLEQHN